MRNSEIIPVHSGPVVKGLFGVLFALITLSSCMAVPSRVRPPLDQSGELLVYLQPVPLEAARLSFRLVDIAAVRDDGQQFPLRLRMHDIEGRDLARQRMLCSGTLPEGSYTGFSFRVAKASLAGEDAASALLVPEEPVLINAPFHLSDRKASAVFLTFEYARSLREGYRFTPVLSPFLPPHPPVGVLGVVSDGGGSSLTLFDKNAMQVVGMLSTGRGPRGVVVDARQKRIYAAISDEDAVEIYDASTLDRVARVRLNGGDEPQGAALTNDGRTLLVANRGSNTVSFIDTGLLMETARLQTGDGPGYVLCDRLGRRAYVFNGLSNSVSVIDLANRALIGSLSTEAAPVTGQFNAKGNILYVISRSSAYLTVFDPLALAQRSRIYVGTGMSALKVDPATDMLYAGRDAAGGIEVYDPLTLVLNRQISAGGRATSLAIDGEANTLWILDGPGGAAQAVNLTSGTVVGRIETGPEPAWIAMMGER